MKLSACMIVGNCAEEVVDTFFSISDVVDEICVLVTKSDDGTLEVCQEHADVVKYAPEFILDGVMKDFSAARNASFELATGDMILWIDSDDVLVNPEQFAGAVRNMADMGIDCIHMDYDYEHDNNGRCTTRHTRERVVRKGHFEWKAPLHEILAPTRRSNVYHMDRSISYIQHNNVQDDHDGGRVQRNLTVLERLEDRDARMTMYYGNALMDAGRVDEAITEWNAYLDESEWDKERYQVHMRLFGAHKEQGNNDAAKACACRAMTEIPTASWAYLGLAEIAAIEKKWADAIHYVKLMNDAEELGSEMVHNPKGMEITPLQILLWSYMNTADFARAQACCSQLLVLEPEKKEKYEAIARKLQKQVYDMDLIKSFKMVVDSTPEEDRENLWSCVPNAIRDYPEFKKNIPKPRSNDKRTVAIYCGFDDTRAWGPEDIEKGIGGSEEAVINVAREFRMAGWNVEVYANVSNEGVIDGVSWYQTSAANTNDLVDLCILWRHPHHLYDAPRGQVTWLWNHDLQDHMEPYYDADTMSRIDRVMFLSEFHRKTAPWVEDEKVFLTTNGVDPKLMASGNNDATTAIFASSPDRGLDTLLEVWPDVVSAVPDAKLNIYYGFNEWFNRRYVGDTKMLEWRSWAEDYMANEPSINYIGRVGQSELSKAFAEAGVWAYPTEFGEISCITAMKAQCSGAIPVCSRYGALDETVNHGIKLGSVATPDIDKSEFTTALIDMMQSGSKQNLIRVQMMSDARCGYGWKQVVDGWLKEFHTCRSETMKTVGSAV